MVINLGKTWRERLRRTWWTIIASLLNKADIPISTPLAPSKLLPSPPLLCPRALPRNIERKPGVHDKSAVNTLFVSWYYCCCSSIINNTIFVKALLIPPSVCQEDTGRSIICRYRRSATNTYTSIVSSTININSINSVDLSRISESYIDKVQTNTRAYGIPGTRNIEVNAGKRHITWYSIRYYSSSKYCCVSYTGGSSCWYLVY